MPESQNVDERSRLLPAIPHRSYVYADELVKTKTKHKGNDEVDSRNVACFYDFRVPFLIQR